MRLLETVLTASEASKRFPISSRQVRHLITKKLVQGRWADGIWLVDATSLKSYLANRPKPGRKASP